MSSQIFLLCEYFKGLNWIKCRFLTYTQILILGGTGMHYSGKFCMVKKKILSTQTFRFKRQRGKRGVNTAHRVKFRVYNVVVAKIKGHALCVKWDAGEKNSEGRLGSSAPAHTDLKQKLKSDFFYEKGCSRNRFGST